MCMCSPVPLPSAVTSFLDRHVDSLRRWRALDTLDAAGCDAALEFVASVHNLLLQHGGPAFKDLDVNGLLGFGQKGLGADLLLLPVSDLASVSTFGLPMQLRHRARLLAVQGDDGDSKHEVQAASSSSGIERQRGPDSETLQSVQAAEGEVAQRVAVYRWLESSVLNGFQLATSSGPLCEEPMMGVAFRIEQFSVMPFEPSQLGMLSG
jgi:hypothetical protein